MTGTEGWLDNLVGPHAGQVVHSAGASLDVASAAVIVLHGRGATAPGILELAPHLETPDVAYLAPQAAGSTWYPHRFLEPRDLNEPHLSSAYSVIARMIARLDEAGIPGERIVLLGFSQGACLATDFAARFSSAAGGLIGFSGGLIGDRIDPDSYSGALDGTPAFLGCSDIDPHIPVARVHETAAVLERLGADLTTTIYPGMGHSVNPDEIEHARRIIGNVAAT